MKWALAFILTLLGCAPQPQDVLVALGGTDAAPADADVDVASRCATSASLFCDGFEAATLDSPPWYFVNRAAAVAVESTRAYRGAQAVHVRLDSVGDFQAVRQGEVTEADVTLAASVYVRAFLYVQSPLTDRRVRIFGLLQDNAPSAGVEVLLESGNVVLTSNGQELESTTSFPLDRWVCFETQIATTEPGSARLWLDDNEVTTVSFSGTTQQSPPLARVTLGAAIFVEPDTLLETNLWVDEVVVDSARVGCSR